MANVNNHFEQVKQNELCYDYLTKADSFSDWCTTVIFYTALHMIDQYLAKYGLHPISHSDRYDYIKKYLPDIRLEYRQLYEASIKSRYGTDFLLAIDKGKDYHDKVFRENFIPISKKMTKVLSTPGP